MKSTLTVAIFVAIATNTTAATPRDVPPTEPLPEPVQSMIPNEGTVIAYKSVNTDGGDKTMAMVVRYTTGSAERSSDGHRLEHEFTCELIAMRSVKDELSVTGRSRHVVDCTSSLQNLNAGYRDLDENLELTAQELKFTNYANTAQGGWHSYSFRFSGHAWHAAEGRFWNGYGVTSEDGDLQESSGIASYPQNFGYISMENFKPTDIEMTMQAKPVTRR